MLSSGVSLIYSFFMSGTKRAERMNQELVFIAFFFLRLFAIFYSVISIYI